jgi:hypothetical protein
MNPTVKSGNEKQLAFEDTIKAVAILALVAAGIIFGIQVM